MGFVLDNKGLIDKTLLIDIGEALALACIITTQHRVFLLLFLNANVFQHSAYRAYASGQRSGIEVAASSFFRFIASVQSIFLWRLIGDQTGTLDAGFAAREAQGGRS